MTFNKEFLPPESFPLSPRRHSCERIVRREMTTIFWVLILLSSVLLIAILSYHLIRWIQCVVVANVIAIFQELVDRMKEYDLDTRAGLLVCSGENLEIRYMDCTLRQLLGCPKSVEDILMPSIQMRHRQIVARFVEGKPLPDSLNHPLRNVSIISKDGETLRAKLIIGKFSFLSRITMQELFYVVIQPCECSLSLKRSSISTSTSSTVPCASEGLPSISCDLSILRKSGSQSSIDELGLGPSDEGSDVEMLLYAYGLDATSYIGKGLVPAAERYQEATVLYVDIVNFTKHCMVKGLEEISTWMVSIHATIDQLLEKHAIRKVETRGDCCICVSGTNFVCDQDAPSRDLSATQAQRMLSFGQDLGLALSAMDGTEVRMGMATGSVVLTHISHGGDTLPAKYIYGDTVNVACRMEQTGRVGMVQLNEPAAHKYAEETATAPPSLTTRSVKGKGLMSSAFYSYVHGRFLSDCES